MSAKFQVTLALQMFEVLQLAQMTSHMVVDEVVVSLSLSGGYSVNLQTQPPPTLIDD